MLNSKIQKLLKQNEKIPILERELHLIKMNDHKLQSKIANIQNDYKINLVSYKYDNSQNVIYTRRIKNKFMNVKSKK